MLRRAQRLGAMSLPDNFAVVFTPYTEYEVEEHDFFPAIRNGHIAKSGTEVLVITNRTVLVGVWSHLEGSTAFVEEMSYLVRMRVAKLDYLIVVACFQIVLTRSSDLDSVPCHHHTVIRELDSSVCGNMKG